MATLLAAAGRRAATLARSPAPSQAASLIPRRGLAGAAGILHLPFFFYCYNLQVFIDSNICKVCLNIFESHLP